jgi:SAM-dependent methyltransferase
MKLLNTIRGIPFFIKDFIKIKKELKNQSEFKIESLYPCLDDKFVSSGNMNHHYFIQDLHVSSKIFINNPIKHVDIGSRIDGFVANVASFRQVEIFDIRIQKSIFDNILYKKADLMNTPAAEFLEYADSLSCLHVIEHFGLGRYGDTIDINGHIIGLKNMYLILKKGGLFYFSTPIGPQRIEFNAHRVFSISYLLNLFNDLYEIVEFSYINDKAVFFRDVILTDELIENNANCKFGCGIFILRKK